jgi:hypothetical protein
MEKAMGRRAYQSVGTMDKMGMGGYLLAGGTGAYLGAKYPDKVKKVTDPLDKAVEDINRNLRNRYEDGGLVVGGSTVLRDNGDIMPLGTANADAVFQTGGVTAQTVVNPNEAMADLQSTYGFDDVYAKGGKIKIRSGKVVKTDIIHEKESLGLPFRIVYSKFLRANDISESSLSLADSLELETIALNEWEKSNKTYAKGGYIVEWYENDQNNFEYFDSNELNEAKDFYKFIKDEKFYYEKPKVVLTSRSDGEVLMGKKFAKGGKIDVSNYRINYFETESDRDSGESQQFDSFETDYDAFINDARRLYKRDGMEAVEVLNEKGETVVIFDNDTPDGEFYMTKPSKKSSKLEVGEFQVGKRVGFINTPHDERVGEIVGEEQNGKYPVKLKSKIHQGFEDRKGEPKLIKRENLIRLYSRWDEREELEKKFDSEMKRISPKQIDRIKKEYEKYEDMLSPKRDNPEFQEFFVRESQKISMAKGGKIDNMIGKKVKVDFRKEVGKIINIENDDVTVFYPELGFSEVLDAKAVEIVFLPNKFAKGGEIDGFTMSMVKSSGDVTKVETEDAKIKMAKGGIVKNQDENHLLRTAIGYSISKGNLDKEDRKKLTEIYNRLVSSKFHYAKGGKVDDLGNPTDPKVISQMEKFIKEKMPKLDKDRFFTDGMKRKEAKRMFYEKYGYGAYNPRFSIFEKGGRTMYDAPPSKIGKVKFSLAKGRDFDIIVPEGKFRILRIPPFDLPTEVVDMNKGKNFQKTPVNDSKIAQKYQKEIQEYLNMDSTRFEKGGKIGFEGLSKKVAKRYVGKKVPKKFQNQYGKTYSPAEAKEVGDKVAGAVYRMQQAKKMAKGGKTQGYNDKLDESLGNTKGKRSTKEQNYKDRRNESEAMEKKGGKRKYARVKTMDKGSRKKKPNSFFAVVKRKQKKGEAWQDAIQRVKKEMKMNK